MSKLLQHDGESNIQVAYLSGLMCTILGCIVNSLSIPSDALIIGQIPDIGLIGPKIK